MPVTVSRLIGHVFSMPKAEFVGSESQNERMEDEEILPLFLLRESELPKTGTGTPIDGHLEVWRNCPPNKSHISGMFHGEVG